TMRSWVDTTNSFLETHTQYDQAGSVRKTYDAKGNDTLLAYSPTFAYAYATLVQTPAPNAGESRFQSSSDYDFNTGLLKSTTNANNQTITSTYDTSNRLIFTSRPTGGGST